MSGVQGSGVQGGEELPPGDAAVADGEPISIRNVNGTDSHAGTAVVSGEPPVIQGINLPAGTAMVDQGDSADLKKIDGSNFIAGPSVTGGVFVANGLMTQIRVPSNETVLKDQQSSINIEQYDNSGFFAATVGVANNEPSLKLANATTRILVNAGGVTISCTNGKTAGATVAIDQGALQNFPLSAATDTIISNNDLIVIENQGSTQQINNAVVEVAAQAPTVKLPPNVSLVADGVGIGGAPVTGTYVDTVTPQVNAAGVITGFTLS